MREMNFEPISVTPQEASDMTGIARKVIVTAIETGCLDCVLVGKGGGKRVVLVSDLHEFLKKCARLGLRIDDDPVNMTKVKKAINYNFPKA